MKLLITAFVVIVAILLIVFGGSYGVARAFVYFRISEDAAFFVGIAMIFLCGIVVLGSMLIVKGIVK